MPNEFANAKEAEIAAALEKLKIEYIEAPRLSADRKSGGLATRERSGLRGWVRQLFPGAKPARLTPPGLETLAIIAYRQPITRADVEAVRGVAIDGVLQTLMERGLVKIAGAPKFRAARCSTRRRNFFSSTSASGISMNFQTPRNCEPAISHRASPTARRRRPEASHPESQSPANQRFRRLTWSGNVGDFPRRVAFPLTVFYLL